MIYSKDYYKNTFDHLLKTKNFKTFYAYIEQSYNAGKEDTKYQIRNLLGIEDGTSSN